MVLKDFIENAMSRLSDVNSLQLSGESASSSSSSSDGITKEERERLLSTIHALELTNAKLEGENRLLQEAVVGHSAQSPSRTAESIVAVANSESIQQELFDVRRELDDRVLELESLHADYAKLQVQLNAQKEQLVKVEVESQMMADQIEIARETHSKLLRAEANIEKYQKKLEEVTSIRLEVVEASV